MKTKLMMLSIVTLGLFLGGCTSNSNSLPKESSAVSNSTSNSNTSTSNAKKAVPAIKLTVTEVISAYEKAYPNTSITSIDLDTSFGAYYFEVQGVDDNKEYELKINAETGEETKEREENLDIDEKNGVKKAEDSLELNDIITLEDATAFASEALGVNPETATDWSLDREMTVTYWEVTFESGRSESSVKLDAKTGDVLEKELEE
ncbi:PepSY domain-containing protein [uncultured Vagococcus sp.]|uniref:PepSY domain-containing protein n=1 Tax=uncultured Vagococcus sp. TaxID=189676 RepID=UPI0028D0F891|nr:PepSY domain-containing protein [uncultured Vagococcus sp.]